MNYVKAGCLFILRLLIIGCTISVVHYSVLSCTITDLEWYLEMNQPRFVTAWCCCPLPLRKADPVCLVANKIGLTFARGPVPFVIPLKSWTFPRDSQIPTLDDDKIMVKPFIYWVVQNIVSQPLASCASQVRPLWIATTWWTSHVCLAMSVRSRWGRSIVR